MVYRVPKIATYSSTYSIAGILPGPDIRQGYLIWSQDPGGGGAKALTISPAVLMQNLQSAAYLFGFSVTTLFVFVLRVRATSQNLVRMSVNVCVNIHGWLA